MMLGCGTATLVAGTVTVLSPKITASAKVFLTRGTSGGVIGDLQNSAIVAATSFTITSTNALDTSQVHWMVIV